MMQPKISASVDENVTERWTFENHEIRQLPKKKRPPEEENFAGAAGRLSLLLAERKRSTPPV